MLFRDIIDVCKIHTERVIKLRCRNTQFPNGESSLCFLDHWQIYIHNVTIRGYHNGRSSLLLGGALCRETKYINDIKESDDFFRVVKYRKNSVRRFT